MAFPGCHRSSFTSAPHKSPQRDLWPLIRLKRIKMLVLGRTDENSRAKTLHNAHFLQVPFCILLYMWEFVACAIFAFTSDLCVCTAVWNGNFPVLPPFITNSVGIPRHEHGCSVRFWSLRQADVLCDHYYGICVIELGWTKFSSSAFPLFIIGCGHKLEICSMSICFSFQGHERPGELW